MSLQRKKNNVGWKHPVPLALLQLNEFKKSIPEIVEDKALSLLKDLEMAFSFSNKDVCVPIESIASSFNININKTQKNNSSTLASLGKFGDEYNVHLNIKGQHYYQRRFTLAHEIGHIFLRQIVGALSFDEMLQTKDSYQEEEALCDLFASAILLPKSSVEKYINQYETITPRVVTQIAKDFKVSKSVVLRRIAWLKNCILILWDDVKNPLNKDSDSLERIVNVYPITPLSTYYVPLYCTANNARFSPNLIFESYEKCTSNVGFVDINGLGSLPKGKYFVTNMFFQRWSESLINLGAVKKRKQFFNVATLINLEQKTEFTSIKS